MQVAASVLLSIFFTHSLALSTTTAYKGGYNGPPNVTLAFNTPEGTPGAVASFEAHPLGSSAFLLKWQKPLQTNGVLTGYRIYYQSVIGTKVGPLIERKPITDARQMHAKLAGLHPNTKYSIHIKATTRAGEGVGNFVLTTTMPAVEKIPDTPQFRWYYMPADNGLANIKVVWLPNVDGHPGSYFQVKYRIRGERMFETTDFQIEEDFIVLRGLKPGENYEMQVVAADGYLFTESKIEDVKTYYAPTHIKEVAYEVATTFGCNFVSDPSLKLIIGWLKNSQPIDFEAEPRFVISTNYSLTITKTNELDSGTYTCVVSTELDSVEASAILHVKGDEHQIKLQSGFQLLISMFILLEILLLSIYLNYM